MALVVKNSPAHAGGIRLWVQSLGQEGPLEEGRATPRMEEPDGLQSVGLPRV